MRLGFAVAAHLEPDILIVDEVLAVGDAAFQRKCVNRMEDAAHDGRTVLFVSHNMPAVESLCNGGLLLDRGTVRSIGSATDVVAEYTRVAATLRSTSLTDRTDREGNGKMRIIAVESQIRTGADLQIAELTKGSRG